MSPGRGGWEKGGKKTERKSGELKEATSPVSRSTQSQSSRAEHVMASLVKTERVKRRDRKMWCSTFARVCDTWKGTGSEPILKENEDGRANLPSTQRKSYYS